MAKSQLDMRATRDPSEPGSEHQANSLGERNDGAEHVSIIVMDWGAYQFTVDFARAISTRPHHQVRHVSCAGVTLPNAGKATSPTDTTTEFLKLRRPFAKYGWRRIPSEFELAFRSYRRVMRSEADHVILVNNPPLAQLAIAVATHRKGALFTHWVQDLYGIGAQRIAQSGTVARLLAKMVMSAEAWVLRSARSIIAISPHFADYLRNELKIAGGKILVEPNWADPKKISPDARVSTRTVFNTTETVFLYTGTLGLKHDLDILERLAHSLLQSGGRLVVVTEGDAVRRLESCKNVYVLPFQTSENHATMLASADVLVVVLNADAGEFSVPSKVNAYLCAGRPILASIPHNNLAAELVAKGGGRVSDPANVADFLLDAEFLSCASGELRDEIGREARSLAEASFQGPEIAERLLAHLTRP